MGDKAPQRSIQPVRPKAPWSRPIDKQLEDIEDALHKRWAEALKDPDRKLGIYHRSTKDPILSTLKSLGPVQGVPAIKAWHDETLGWLACAKALKRKTRAYEDVYALTRQTVFLIWFHARNGLLKDTDNFLVAAELIR